MNIIRASEKNHNVPRTHIYIFTLILCIYDSIFFARQNQVNINFEVRLIKFYK
jgi:hypothetical protein